MKHLCEETYHKVAHTFGRFLVLLESVEPFARYFADSRAIVSIRINSGKIELERSHSPVDNW